jgi:uncharacterized membrane protein YphA (DoxX/SURF4 family)
VLKRINIQVILRVLIGLLLIVSGGEKLLSHYQNFLYVIESYAFLPTPIEKLAALTVPWIEFLVGISLVLGLWLNWSLKLAVGLFTCFITIVSQAIIRQLPITECGCFGEGLSFPLHVILLFDSCVFICLIFLNLTMGKAKNVSLDEYFQSQ